MLDKVLGNETAMKLMLQLYHYGEVYPSAVAKDCGMSLSPVQRQCERFEEAGILISKLVGKTRVYIFNQKSPATKAFMNLIKVYYDNLSLKDKEALFSSRRRPRRAGKPVIGRGDN